MVHNMSMIEDIYKDKDVAGYYDSIRFDVLSYFDGPVDAVLEIGCGSGATLSYIKKAGLANYVVGADINSEQLVSACEHGVDKTILVNPNLHQFEFDAEVFDRILMLDVLEHMVDPWLALKDVSRFLNPDGKIILSIPNVQNLRVIVPLIFGGWKYGDAGILDKTHLRFFTKKTVFELVESAGLRVESVNANLETHLLPVLMNFLTFRIFERFVTVQFVLVCKKK